MQRKKASLAEVYDARALRIVVGDEDGKRHKVSLLTHSCLCPLESRVTRRSLQITVLSID